MTVVGTHRGPISGITHIHLLREDAAARTRRSAEAAKIDDPGTDRLGGRPEATVREPSVKGTGACPA